MKKFTGILFGLLFSLSAISQTRSAAGRWEGVLNVGVDLRIVFNVKESASGELTATADSPDQSVYDIAIDRVVFHADSLFIYIKALGASYQGRMINDSVIVGELTQGTSFPLVLKRGGVIKERIRPQTPKPPYPYREENITYYNSESSIRFGGSLTIPHGKGPFPSVVLISGSGPQDRNSNILGHALFHVLADHLTRNGVIVFRYDERGIGETGGNFATATSADFASDVHAAVNELRRRPEVDQKRIGLIGHSEGGMIAPMVASSRNDISFLVLLAAPGVPHIELMALQNEAVARSQGINADIVAQIAPLFRGMTTAIVYAANNEEAHSKAGAFLRDWIKDKDTSTLSALNLQTESKRGEYLTAMVEQLRSPWFLYFTRFDPTPYLQKLSGKVLALNGTRDIQVIHSQNLPAIENSLKKSKVDKFEIRELEGLNHLFQTCKTCTLNEYGLLEESFSTVALKTISGWIHKEIGKQKK